MRLRSSRAVIAASVVALSVVAWPLAAGASPMASGHGLKKVHDPAT